MVFDVVILRLFAGFVLLLAVDAASAWQPLEPADTSSPRETMESFLRLTKEATQRWAEFRDSPGPTTQKRLFRIVDHAQRLFDLRQVGRAVHREVAVDTFSLLWEVMARTTIPDLDQIPGTGYEGGDAEAKKLPASWRVPGTEIRITRVDEGSRAGEFLFSADTVARAREFYDAVRERPYRQTVPSGGVIRLSQGFTGWMIPLAWVEALPGWATHVVAGQILWKWFVLVGLFGLVTALIVLVYRWTRRRPRDSALASFLLRAVAPITTMVSMQLLLYLGTYQLNASGAGAQVLDFTIELASAAAIVWLIWVTATWVAERIIASPRIHGESLDANLIRLGARSVGILAGIVLLLRLGDDVGIPLYGLVAGAGVGGIAIALATKTTLENFMGALNLFADRPVRVGDLCRYDEDHTGGWRPVGQVESIGLRSIKIRKFDRSLITIPNAEFAQRHIVNLSSCDRFLLTATLGLRYETTDDQLRFVLAEIRELLHAHPMAIHTAQNPLRVRFIGFGDCSLDVAIRAYIRTSSYNEFLAVQEDILLRIMKIVERAGTGFAFPSRTLYHAADAGLDKDKQEAAEKQVREWASAQALPFPEFDEDYRKKVTDTLDYPPDGSPEADRG